MTQASEPSLRVLLIEDDSIYQMLIQALLDRRDQPTTLIAVSSVREAKALLEEQTFDIVLLDLNLPDSSGLGTFEKVAQSAPELPVIVLTGDDDINLATAALQQGAQDYLVKTDVKWNVLDRAIRYALDRHRGRRAEQQLLESRKLESIGQLAAGIAHEINTPTQYVGDNTQYLRDTFAEILEWIGQYRAIAADIGEQDTQQSITERFAAADQEIDFNELAQEIPEAIDQSLEGIAQISKIVQAMREFSHPGTGEKVYVNLNESLEKTITVCRNEWKYVANLTPRLDPELPLVACLPSELNQVFLNIIVNAAHAIGEQLAGNEEREKGTIDVSSKKEGDIVAIQITDNGPGIPQNIRNRIFDPFFTTKEVGKGTGQGLAIARTIVVNKHGGEITVDSAEGKGTTFTILLPIEPPAL